MAAHHITTDVKITNPATHTTALIAAEYVDVSFDIFNCSYAEDVHDNVVLPLGLPPPVLPAEGPATARRP
ncbi:MAG: hypothetical protein HY330_01255 [Chloroflexi bacterium]|nr:hypothetical protein [Chloroflexota bacterium]